MFASLHTRNYRLYLSGQVVSNVGTWMQRIAQDWLVLDLTHGSATALGIAAALQFAPMLVLTLWGGVLADRVDKRTMLVVVQSAMGLCALVLGTVVLTGVVELWQVYAFCLLLGCFSAFDTPMRQSFVSEMVGPGQVVNAVALNSLVFNLARIVGPAVAGLLIVAIGTGWVFLLNAVSFLGVIAGLLLMRPEALFRTEGVPRAPHQLREGLAYVRSRPDLVAILVLVFLVSTFGINFFMTIALLARNVFGRDAEGYGLLTTLLAVGSVLGAMIAARRSAKPRLRVVAGSGLAFGVVLTVAGSMPTYLAAGLALIPVGFLSLSFTTAANSSVQLSVPPELRGRVMAIYMLVLLGGTPLGGPLLGVLAEHYGGRAPLVAGGIVTVLSVLAVGAVLARRQVALSRVLTRQARLG
ncbi:MFS transporter [Pseudonocardia ailaonensis]|uniref:MFS transporter n=2 Tax=Pseudonocardia ailaonensis TaxID=367279 RepID=A0ABN2NHG4_9PSEU